MAPSLLLHVSAQASGATEGASHVDFVYVDANEGSASGGHFALRLGDRTFHFGHHEPGMLRLDREDAERFERVYGTLENRNLRILRIAVSADTHERLRTSFNERFLCEQAEFELLGGLGRDRRFLEEWRVGRPRVEIRGAAYLEPIPGLRADSGEGDAMARIRRRVQDRYGPDFLPARMNEASRALAALAGAAREPVPPLAPPCAHPRHGYGLARRAVDAETRLRALGLLRYGARLRREATIVVPRRAFPIDAGVRQMLASLAAGIEDDIVGLVASRRADAGFPLAVALGRLLAIEETDRSGRLTVLDVFPTDAMRMSVEEIEARGGRMERLEREVRGDLLRLRDALLAKPGLREADYAALEIVAARHHELERSRTTGADLRVAVGPLLPARSEAHVAGVGPPPPDGVLARRLAEVRAREEEQGVRLGAAHRYDLLGHNCVSELFAQVERALAAERDDARSASIARLGGYVSPRRGPGVIPFVAAAAAADEYDVAQDVRLPSHRRRRVAQQVRREGAIAALRESNVLTSTVYRTNPVDSAFLFFTDDSVVARPLLGAANLLYGIGASVAGLPFAPLDGGRLLSAGLRGALWSVPELAFVNVRKGSFFFLPREAEPYTGTDDYSPSR